VARLFFAVWPEAASAQRLAALGVRLGEESGGKAVPVERIHLTLAFLGALDAEARTRAVKCALAIRAAPFEIAIDRAGSFRRARVAWAGTSIPPAALLDLQRELADRLKDAGIWLEDRPFAPHATLVRKTKRALPESRTETIRWAVEAFTLVRSETGTGRYVVEERWGLGV
jgi:2'-5' RNA ligase